MANRYWVGGTATWDATAGTKWSAISGGSGGESVPTSADSAIFDANSGTGTVSVSGQRQCLELLCDGFTGTFAGVSNGVINVYGETISLDPGTVFNQINGPTLAIQAAMPFFYLNGALPRGVSLVTTSSELFLEEDLVIGGLLTVSAGSFYTQDYNVTAGGFSSSSSNLREIDMGIGSIWTLNGSSAVMFDLGTVTNLTLIDFGAQIFLNTGAATGHQITANIEIGAPIVCNPRTVANSRFQFSGTGGVADLTVLGPNNIELMGNIVFGDVQLKGNPDGAITLGSTTAGFARTVTVDGQMTGQYVAVRDVTKAGAGTMILGPAWNCGNNSGDMTLNPAAPRARSMIGI